MERSICLMLVDCCTLLGAYNSIYQSIKISIIIIITIIIIIIIIINNRLRQFQTVSLRSSRFRFLQAKQGNRARALGKKEQKSRSGGRGGEGSEVIWGRSVKCLGSAAGVSFPSPPLPPPPPAPTFLLLFAQCPRAITLLGLKETEMTATQAIKQ